MPSITTSEDTEGRRIAVEIRKTNGELIRRMTSTLDALGRDISSFDTFLTCDIAYDAGSNRRYVKAALTDPKSGKTVRAEHWFKCDETNRVIVDNGARVGDSVDIQEGVGTRLGYVNGDRASETRITGGREITNRLTYNDDHFLVVTEASDGFQTKRQYTLENWQEGYHESGGGRDQIDRSIRYTSNSWKCHEEESKNGKQQSRTDYSNFTATGLSRHQKTNYNGEDDFYDEVGMDYRGFDSFQLTRINADRNFHGRWSHATPSELLFDSNGTMNATFGTDEGGANYKPKVVIFDATCNGLVLSKLTLLQRSSIYPSQAIAKGSCFYTVNDHYMGSYGIEEKPYGSRGEPAGTPKLNFSGYSQPVATDQGGGCIALRSQQISYPTQAERRAVQSPGLGRLNIKALNLASPLSFTDNSYPPPTTSDFLVTQDNETFASIARRAGLDESYAVVIAEINGLSVDDVLSKGQEIKLPQLMIAQNTADSYPAYETFQAIMIGNLFPHLVTNLPKKHHHRSFFHMLVDVLAVGIAFMVAPHLGVVILKALVVAEGAVTSALATGVSAALVHAAEQEVAVSVGLQDHFSLKASVEVGISAGFTAGFTFGQTGAALGRQLVNSAKVAVSDQLTAMATGLRKQFDPRAVVNAVTSTLIGTQVGAPPTSANFGQRAASATLTTTMNELVSSALYHREPNFTSLAASAMGTVGVQEAGGRMNTVLDNMADRMTTPSLAVSNPQIDQAQRVADMQLPDAKIDFAQAKKQLREIGEAKYAAAENKTHVGEEKTRSNYLMQSRNQEKWRNALFSRTSTAQNSGRPRYPTGIPQEKGLEPVFPEFWLMGGVDLAKLGVGLWRAGARALGRGIGGESVVNWAAKNHISGLRLQQQLKLKQASSIFNESGYLTEEAIRNSQIIIRGNDLRNPQLIDALAKRGNLADWGKYATKQMPSPSGSFEMHFYRNSVTGEVYYGRDYKAIFDHQGLWNFEPKPNFEYEPPRFNK